MDKIFQEWGLGGTISGTFDGKWHPADTGRTVPVKSPIDGSVLATVSCTTDQGYEAVLRSSWDTFHRWRLLPAPKRGEVIRRIGNALREHKDSLGRLVTMEMGKILAEGQGEVQEAIDIADFAVGLSRQLYGNTMHSERPGHRMYEQWHPLGPVGVITAFNFPVAVWAWNAMIAAVCGDTVIWKASELTPLSAVVTTKICAELASQHGFPGLFTLITGEGAALGAKLAADSRVPLISATGSCRMGRAVGETVAKRLGRSILELGGNNAIIVLEDADLDLTVRATLFGAVGTAGQRCTTIRRAIVEESIVDEFTKRLVRGYRQLTIGNPLHEGVLVGPLIHEQAVAQFERAISTAIEQGGKVVYGGKRLNGMPNQLYVEPTIISARKDMAIVKEETFAPILYIIPVADIDEAIEVQNDVPQGLSSAIFTRSLKTAEQFLSAAGSDCGIANVNIGTSGAEIGGAFGGEKETGGGREAGSDAWKQYMRRQTCTINYSDALPLAQGIKFETS
ncbi:MAG: aldehyde dehydrogenase family protein [Bdellovibrionota bacterium]|nr:MAG: aldehyde dehydrogenase family protein [Bdellovibrionota bacterium]